MIQNLSNYIQRCKQNILRFVLLRIFLLSSKKRQNYLIAKNACLFLGMQNVANHYGNDGDVKSQMDISEDSYKYLIYFALYCDAKGIDQVKRLKLYDS